VQRSGAIPFGHCHAMTPEDFHHFRAVGRAFGSADYFGSLAEVRGAHDRGGYDGELFHILAAEVIKAVHRSSWDAQRLPGTNLDWRAVNRPGKDAVCVELHIVGFEFRLGGRRSSELVLGGGGHRNRWIDHRAISR
jgi:hypothetical protein